MGFWNIFRSGAGGLDSFGRWPPSATQPKPQPIADPTVAAVKALPEDLHDAALAGFPLDRVEAARRSGLTLLDTTIDEIRRVRREKIVDLNAHPDANPGPETLRVARTVNDAGSRMIERRRR